jgi:hypothetical protein
MDDISWALVKNKIFKNKGSYFLKVYGNGGIKLEYVLKSKGNMYMFNKSKTEEDQEILFYNSPKHRLIDGATQSHTTSKGAGFYIAVEGAYQDAMFKYRDYEELISKTKEYLRIVTYIKDKFIDKCTKGYLDDCVRSWYKGNPRKFINMKIKYFANIKEDEFRSNFKKELARLYVNMQYTRGAKSWIGKMLNLERPTTLEDGSKSYRNLENILVNYITCLKGLVQVFNNKTNTFVNANEILKNSGYSKDQQTYVTRVHQHGVATGNRLHEKSTRNLSLVIVVLFLVLGVMGYFMYKQSETIASLSVKNDTVNANVIEIKDLITDGSFVPNSVADLNLSNSPIPQR